MPSCTTSRVWLPLVSLSFLVAPLVVAQDTLSGDWLRLLPVDEPRHALSLIPGARLPDDEIGVTPFPRVVLRGDAAARGNVYVDGASLRFETLGGAGIGLAPSGVAAVAVTTGVAPAALADAAGGVLSYTTRSGGDRLRSDLRWESDEPFSDRATVGYNRLAGTVSGPFGAISNLTFFLTGELEGQESSYRGPGAADVPAYVPAGRDTLSLPVFVQRASGLRRPLDWATARRAQAKLAYHVRGSAFSLTLLDGDVQQRFFPGQAILDSGVYQGRRAWTAAAIVNWRQALGEWRAHPVALAVNVSLVRQREIAGGLDTASQSLTRDPGLGIELRTLHFLGADVLNLPVDQALVRDLRTNSGTHGVPFFNAFPDLTQSGRLNPYGLRDNDWWTAGLGGQLTEANEQRVQGRAALEWRGVELGADAERSRVGSYASDIVRQIGTDAVTARPQRIGIFAGARAALAGLRVDLGVRVDRFTPGGEFPLSPAFVSSDPRWNLNAATSDTAYINSVARVFRPAREQTAVSPRIQLTYPVGRLALHAGYARSVEAPSWATFFAHANSDDSFTGSTTLFGRDIHFAQTSLWEAGARYIAGPTTLAITGYRTDLPVYGGLFQNFPDPRDSSKLLSIEVLSLLGHHHGAGVDVGVASRRGWVSVLGAYSFERVSSRDIIVLPNAAPVTTHDVTLAGWMHVPDDWRRGSTMGTLARGADVVLLARARNGEPYTPLFNFANGTLGPDNGFTSSPSAAINSGRLSWFKTLDLRIAKPVRSGGHTWSLFVDVRNLLNFSNLVSLFAETGDTANALFRKQVIGDPALGTGEYGLLHDEAANAGALQADGTTVDLTACGSWAAPVNCLALTRVERRFGNGDGIFTLAEQQQAFNAFYRDFFGSWRLYAPGRTLRVGMALAL